MPYYNKTKDRSIVSNPSAIERKPDLSEATPERQLTSKTEARSRLLRHQRTRRWKGREAQGVTVTGEGESDGGSQIGARRLPALATVVTSSRRFGNVRRPMCLATFLVIALIGVGRQEREKREGRE
ncbi:hypothetical protein TIFTF001_000907 [Ficus carica]|uniref:Uncharacterized protein n=1 Tax=Ficus carica TaxID=3494 RepID=A0AA88CQ86_FICCA|nr:hypothetical protein TIFTF001_000907 [Ficus carica]